MFYFSKFSLTLTELYSLYKYLDETRRCELKSEYHKILYMEYFSSMKRILYQNHSSQEFSKNARYLCVFRIIISEWHNNNVILTLNSLQRTTLVKLAQ